MQSSLVIASSIGQFELRVISYNNNKKGERNSMEPMSAILEGEWRSLSGTCTNEESDFMAELIHNYSVQQHQNEFGLDHEDSLIDLDNVRFDDENLFGISDTNNKHFLSSYSSLDSSTSFSPSLHYESCYLPNDSYRYLTISEDSTALDFCLGSEKVTGFSVQSLVTDRMVEKYDCLINQNHMGGTEAIDNIGESKLKTESRGMSLPDLIQDDSLINIGLSKSKKRSRTPSVEKNKRNVKSKKSAKVVGRDKNDIQTTTSCSSKDNSYNNMDSKTSSEKVKNSSGKTRASRGSAKDSQSLYARKRRERINERLKILQNLVPNGTKVDMSTMLEEAVQYVNFLQLQIKLLSSNELWMYSPIAYNGMDMGFN